MHKTQWTATSCKMETLVEIWESFENNLKELLFQNFKFLKEIKIDKHIELDEISIKSIFNFEYLDLSFRKESGKYNNYVSYNNLSITDIDFIKYFPNLKYLNLCGQPSLNNHNGLYNGKNLLEVNVSHQTLQDFEYFRNLTSLESLNLHCLNTSNIFKATPHISIHPLSKLKLTKLNLTRCIFDDFTPLNEIISLKELSLFNTKFQSMNQIGNLENLETLILICCEDIELTPIKFPNLKNLYVSNLKAKRIQEFKILNPDCIITESISANIYKCNARLDYYPKSESQLENDRRFEYLFKACYEEHRGYPKVFIPYDFQKNPKDFQGMEIPTPRKAPFKLSKTGISENYFLPFLKKYFGNNISNELEFVLGNWLPKVPDYILLNNEKKIFIDIEIDEPYSLNDDLLFHFDGKDSDRNFTFIFNNWFVIRFTEEQIIKYPNECCAYIQQFWDYIMDRMSGKDLTWKNDFKFFQESWTEEILIKKRIEKYRESYLKSAKVS